MIILDTCALIFDALNPERLTPLAKKTISSGEKKDELFCCSISLWEIGMLIQKNRLNPGTDTATFLNLLLQARNIQILEINIEIAALATTNDLCKHFDPADRLILATAKHHDATLITSDEKLKNVKNVSVVW